ncbi:MAG: hypothetical protein JEZ11_04415 [Desulfobacterales bacterium]|nr:hypothetical protein [Desulfobacterales bacterium]
MDERLRQSYCRWLLPILVAAAGILVVRVTGPGLARMWTASIRAWMPWIFCLSLAGAVAGPVMVRAAFAHGVRGEARVGESAFFRFRLRLIQVSMIGPYLALAALVPDSPGFHGLGILLAAFYAVYYGYPSKDRIDFDRRLFRVKAGA